MLNAERSKLGYTYEPVVLMITRPRKGAMMNRVLLGVCVDRSDLCLGHGNLLPSLNQPNYAYAIGVDIYLATFVGYNVVPTNNGESITCQVPMMMTFGDGIANDLWGMKSR